ncbi:MAG: cell division protein FtsL [Buchnera aphidicola (Nurudea yanoniella)]
MNNNTYNLSKIILKDLAKLHKITLMLLAIITIFSILTVVIIHKTRLLITQEEKLNIIRNKIEINWNNLTVKRHLSTSHDKIEKDAREKLNMQSINPSQENIIFQ